MPSIAEADRNLLFGVLAVQMDFVSRDQLFDAMQAWVFDKTTPIGRIMLDRSILDHETHGLLESLVAKHVARHGGDPRKSLVAVGSSRASTFEDLSRIADADLDASLTTVMPETEDDPYRTQSHAHWTASDVEGRYRVLRPHARGALGAVFVAHDAELNREVALKEIQERFADNPASRARFQLEAEINGGLEHPGIVPVHGLGCKPDGRPFYVMRFVRGDTLKAAIEAHHKLEKPGDGLAFRKLLARFLDVCHAVDYAHSRGVLHRDLKPSNVMLGKYGETLVVDWGLAKVVGRPDLSPPDGEATLEPASSGSGSETLPGSALGTPQYMSPEQSLGHLDRLGPATDIYSLGSTLYTLLTGHVPFGESDVGVVLQRVQKGDFPNPRKHFPAIAPALEAVCLKAMALDPAQRYASAKALAEDVERWLADEPVLCRREPRSARIGRWSRKHKTMLAGMIGALVVGMLTASAGTLAYVQVKADSAQAKRLLDRLEARIDLALNVTDSAVDAVPPAPPAPAPAEGPVPPIGSNIIEPPRKAAGNMPEATALFMPTGWPWSPHVVALMELRGIIQGERNRFKYSKRAKINILAPADPYQANPGASPGVVGPGASPVVLAPGGPSAMGLGGDTSRPFSAFTMIGD